MPARPSVSLTMIVRNEESNLRACLQPVARLFDEMIVVDTGSTDQTRQLATELGARVFEFPWCDDFAAARNESVRHASGDWVFWLDADDRLDEANLRRLEKLLIGLDGAERSYMMNCVSQPVEASDPALVIQHCRLFRRQPGHRWRRRVHEQIDTGTDQRVFTDVEIHHMGYRDPALLRRKANRDLRLLRLEYAAAPTDPHTLFFLGMAHQSIGDDDAALTHLLSSLKYSARESGDWLRRLYALLYECLLRLGRHEEALAMLAEGLRRFPDDVTLATRHAEMQACLGDLGGAERGLLELLRRPLPATPVPGHQPTLDRREARYLLGMIYRDLHRTLDSQLIFQELLSQYPDYIQGWIGLGYAYLDQGRPSEVEFVARQMEKCPNGLAYAANLRAAVHMVRGETERARQAIDQAQALLPQLIWTRMLRLDWLCLAQAPWADRIAVCRDILRLSPGNTWATAKLQELERQERGATSPTWFTVIVS